MRSTRSSAWPSRPSRSVRSRTCGPRSARGADLRDHRGRRIVPLGPSSIRKLVDTRDAVLDDAIQDGHIDRNPARGKRMRVRVPQRTFLELDELPALIDAAWALEQRQEFATLARLETLALRLEGFARRRAEVYDSDSVSIVGDAEEQHRFVWDFAPARGT